MIRAYKGIMKTLRTIGLLLALAIPAIAAAATPTIQTCCPSDCCPHCPLCPSHLHK